MNYGYAGYYNGVYLRSSYEYAYAMYLDSKSIEWKYEKLVYKIGEKTYKPDFSIYQNGELYKIVEVKSKKKTEIQKAISNLSFIEKSFGLKVELVSYEKLLKIYTEMPTTLNYAIQSWIKSPDTSLGKSISGNLNPHFNIKHSQVTKELIGSKTRERWKDKETKEKMLKGLRLGVESMKNKKGQRRAILMTKNCKLCNKTFKVSSTSTKELKKKYCSLKCSNTVHNQTKLASLNKEKKIERHRTIKLFFDKWCIENAKQLGDMKGNIKGKLDPFLFEAKKEFNTKDIRVITEAVLGEGTSRLQLKKYIINLIK